jgi:hypothetical protein
MNCEQWLPRIEEYVDGELDDSSVKRLRSHLALCPDCSNEYKQLRMEQELYQSYVRDVDVTPALWATVQARIQQDGAGPSILDRLRRLGSAFTSGPRLSPVYAMLLVILAVAVTVIVMRRSGNNNRRDAGIVAKETPAPTPSPTSTPLSGGGQEVPSPKPESPARDNDTVKDQLAKNEIKRPEKPAAKPAAKPAPITAEQAIREAEQKYVAAIAILSRDANKHRSELDPAVAAKFEATLASLDFTIKETRRAVHEHPGDPVAAQYMMAAYSEKLDVLREMAGQ